MTQIDQYAVFGSPIKHSKSPSIHRIFAEQTGQELVYTAQEVTADRFESAVTEFFSLGGKGLNCTVPLKELAWRFADRKTERAESAKAVNTLALQTDGSILGDNTDGIGLVTDLIVNHGLTLNGKKLLILGAGGASRGILSPLFEQQPECIVIANRTASKAVNLAGEFASRGDINGCGFDELAGLSFDVILNATSASLSNELPPLPEGLLAPNGVCYDLAYGNEPTAFVRWGISHGAASSLDGLGMLVEQAAEAFLIWRGVRPDTAPVIKLLNGER
ncbi:MAG: shikimate dehydrogenase, partial [Methylomicrobium sp.]|nr:shikimate dehydrogenase [Methylomicrobium sp.]